MFIYALLLWVLTAFRLVLGDGINWIDPYYAVMYTHHPKPEADHAAHAIVLRARSSAKQGPFTVTKGSIFAPSGKKQDYLSWAPYHWPNCNWCKNRGSDRTLQQYDTPGANTDEQTTGNGCCCSDSGRSLDAFTVSNVGNCISADHFKSTAVVTSISPSGVILAFSSLYSQIDNTLTVDAFDTPLSTILQEADVAGGRAPHTRSSSCKPTPTSSMAPAATWTTCPYEAKDGQVNNDRNQLYGLSQLNMASQSIIDNALASVLDRNPDAAEVASRFLDVFFIDKKRGISPHLEWGQTIRGPSQRGSYMGVLDLRVLVKVVNAIQILRISKTSHWSRERDNKMLQWAKSYLDWLESSELGKRPSKSANNHSSFYHGQLAALKILIGDKTGALKIVQAYFSGPFREQIVSSGEQPFESTRKKPFHYRAFNLEAMIALAKLGDYLGVSMWNTQTRYKSTIKTAIDYLITLDAGHEDTKVALPLVAAAMAVYGDNQGSTYRKYLEAQGTQTVNNGRTKVWKYMTKSWWFYEHPEAVRVSDSDHQTRAIYDLASQEIIGAPLFNSGSDTRNEYSSPDMHDYPEVDNEWDDPYRFASANLPTHPERPPPFVLTDAVELEEGIYVYWSQISHLYDQSPGGRRSVWAKW